MNVKRLLTAAAKKMWKYKRSAHNVEMVRNDTIGLKPSYLLITNNITPYTFEAILTSRCTLSMQTRRFDTE